MPKKLHRYSVDIYDLGYVNEWKRFKTLRKAVRFAIKHNLTADRVIDNDAGNNVEGLDLSSPQWMSHRELETLLARARERTAALEAEIARAKDDRLNHQIIMIQAGYVPLALFADRLLDVRAERTGGGIANVPLTRITLDLDGDTSQKASINQRSPFATFLEALNKGLNIE